MKALLSLALFFPAAAAADLYRWVDPETGSVKFSNFPPTVPVGRVEVVPYTAPGALRAGVAPARPAESSIAASLKALEAQWRSLRQALDSIPPQAEFERAGAGLSQHAEAYRAVRAELDRVDPAGAARRRAEDEPLLARLARGLKSQLEPAPPVR